MSSTVTIYRDDSTAPVVYANVKHVFWTANNTVLTIAQYDSDGIGHHYICWLREHLCWFRHTAHSTKTKPSTTPTD